MTTIQCCGKSRSTPFCPQCGKRLTTTDPLLDLLVYLRIQAKKISSKAESYADAVATGHGTVGPADVQAALSAATRWRNWADALAAKIGAENVPE
jgi:hypothetical protein